MLNCSQFTQLDIRTIMGFVCPRGQQGLWCSLGLTDGAKRRQPSQASAWAVGLLCGQQGGLVGSRVDCTISEPMRSLRSIGSLMVRAQ